MVWAITDNKIKCAIKNAKVIIVYLSQKHSFVSSIGFVLVWLRWDRKSVLQWTQNWAIIVLLAALVLWFLCPKYDSFHLCPQFGFFASTEILFHTINTHLANCCLTHIPVSLVLHVFSQSLQSVPIPFICQLLFLSFFPSPSLNRMFASQWGCLQQSSTKPMIR